MSLIDPGGTTRRTRAARKARRVKPNDHDEPVKGKGKRRNRKPKAPPAPKTRPLGPADIIQPSHPLYAPLVGWLQAKSQKLGRDEDLPVTKRQARKFLAAHPQYRGVQVPVEEAA